MNTNNTTKTKYTANGLIVKRETTLSDIKDLWIKLAKNNVIPIGTTPAFDLKAIYKLIGEKELSLVKTKLAIQAVNMGFKDLSSLPENNVYTQIYLLQQLKERKVKLEKINTRKNENETVILTKVFVESELKKVLADINKIQKEINDFNEKVEFEEK